MPKFTKKTLNSGFSSTDDLEENFDNLETFSDTVLSRDGTTPNAMNAVLDMNSNRIINTSDPLGGQDVATKNYVDSIVSDPGSFTLFAGTVTGFAASLLDDPDASTVMDTLGFSTFFKTLVDDATAGDFLTTLGVSSFAQTLLDDATAGDARTTLGLGNLSTLNAGLGVSINGSDLDLDINELTEESAIASGDFVPFYDTTAAALRKVDLDDLVAAAQVFSSQSLASEGYVVFNDGLVIQWGQTGTGFSGTETLPLAMPNNLWIVVATNERNSSSPGSDEEIRVHSFTTTQFGWFHIQGTNFNHYIAIGN